MTIILVVLLVWTAVAVAIYGFTVEIARLAVRFADWLGRQWVGVAMFLFLLEVALIGPVMLIKPLAARWDDAIDTAMLEREARS